MGLQRGENDAGRESQSDIVNLLSIKTQVLKSIPRVSLIPEKTILHIQVKAIFCCIQNHISGNLAIKPFETIYHNIMYKHEILYNLACLDLPLLAH